MDKGSQLTVDEIIAHNFTRLSERYSVTGLAKALGVGRGLVYDMKGPRGKRPQRQFLWSDLVMICATLDIDLYELVLPPDDVEVAASPGGWGSIGPMDRDTLSYHIFGIPLGKWSPEIVSDLREQIQGERRRITKEYRRHLQKVVDDTNALQRAYEGVQRDFEAIQKAYAEVAQLAEEDKAED